MIIKTTYTFTDEDKKLLNAPLPENPCLKCGIGIACCGCPAGREYDAAVAPYKDHSIWDIALQVEEARRLKNEIEKMETELCEIKAVLPDFIEI